MKPEMVMPAAVNVRTLAAVSDFASTEDTRYYINGVRLEIEPRSVTYIATDGHRLMALHEKKGESDPDNDLVGGFTVPTAQCRFFKCSKKDHGAADLFGDNNQLTLKRGDVGVCFEPIAYGANTAIAGWVDWRRVVPRIPLTQGTGQFDGVYLGSFQKLADKLLMGSKPFIAHNGADGPALVRFPGHCDAIGVIMPFRAEDRRMAPLPLWVDTPFKQAAE